MRKRVFLTVALVLLVAVVVSGCVTVSLGPSFGHNQGISVHGVGEQVSFPVAVDSFSAVELNGQYEIVYRTSPVSAVRFEIHENLIEYLDIRVESGALSDTLIINSDVHFVRNSTPTVYIYAPQLDSIRISGASMFKDWDTLTAESLELNISGAADGTLPLNVQSLSVVVAGAAGIQLEGSAVEASIMMAGAGNIAGGGLQTQSSAVNITGAGSVNIAVSDTLNAQISGAGRVFYIGDPIVTQSVLGAGSVTRAR